MSRMTRIRGWTYLALIAVLACGSGDDAGESVPIPEWTARLDVRVGSVDDPEYTLTFFRRMEVGPGGRMYTAHPMEQVIRVFEPDGTLAGSIGGEGEGPGEFGNLLNLGWVADTLWVLDGRGYRFNLFDAEGSFLTSFSVPFGFGEDPQGPQPPRASGLLPDGTVHGSPPAFSHQVADGTLTHHRPMLMTRDGVVTDTLPPVAFGRNTWAISDPENPDRGGMYASQPFADGPLWSYVPGERAVVHLLREAPEVPEDASLLLTKMSFDGDTLYSRSITFTPLPVAPEEADSLIGDMAAMMAESGFMNVTEARAREWAAASFFQPAFRPGAAAMVVARDGEIWLREAGEGPMAVWLVLSAEGEPVGRVRLPEGLTVMVVDRPYVWGTETDELDVPYLLRYEVLRD